MKEPKDFYAWPRSPLTHRELLDLLDTYHGRISLQHELTTLLILYLRNNPHHRSYRATREDFNYAYRTQQDQNAHTIVRIYDFLRDDQSYSNQASLNIYYEAYKSACRQITADEEGPNRLKLTYRPKS